MRRTCIALAAVGLVAATIPTIATAADDWPNRPVRVISPFAAGGTADVLARIVADHLSQVFKQQFYVEVLAGAGGQIGVRQLITSKPDGYNLAITNVSHLVLHPFNRPDVTYDPRKDLTNIAFVGGSPIVLAVNAKSGPKSLEDFLKQGKTKGLTYSSSGLGSMGHLFGVNFANTAKIKTEHIPYKGASQGLADLVGGHIIWSSQALSSASSYLRSGSLRGLALSTDKRLSSWPDLPTFKEQGIDLEASIWFALSGPPGMSPELVKKLNEAIVSGLKEPKLAERMQRDGLITQFFTPEELDQFIAREIKIWEPVIKDAGLYAKK